MTTLRTELHKPRHYYSQVADAMRARIQHGQYGSDGALPSERALAEEFDVTQTTINKSLSILVTEGLLERKIGHGTFVLDQSKIRATMVGVVYSDSYEASHLTKGRHPWAIAAADGIARRLDSTPFNLHPFVLTNQTVDEASHPVLYSQLRQGTLAGLIFTSAAVHIDFATYLLALGMPFVTVRYSFPTLLDRVPAVVASTDAIGYRLTQECLAEGRRRIAILHTPQLAEGGYYGGSAALLAGHRRALAEAQVGERAELILPTPHTDQGVAWSAKKLLSLSTPPEAVICAGERMAYQLRDHLHQAGLSVGRGDKGEPGVRIFSANRISGVEGDSNLVGDTLGRLAAQALLNLIDHQPITPLQIVDTQPFELGEEPEGAAVVGGQALS